MKPYPRSVAQRIEVMLTCDVHLGVAPAAETVMFALDGQVLECDLCRTHAAELRRTIATWSARARRVERRAPVPARPATGLRRARRTPVQPRAKERRERLLAAAEVVFAERGYDATNTKLVAAQAEVSVGSVYNLLGSKEAIAVALYERYRDELGARADGLALGRRTLPALVDLVDGFLDDRPALRPLLRHRWGSDELRSARRDFQASLATRVERLIGAQRPFRDPGRRLAAAQLCSGMIWSMLDEASEMPRADRLARLAELKLVLEGYLGVAVVAA